MTIGLVVALAGGFLVLVGAALIVYLAISQSRSVRGDTPGSDPVGPAKLVVKTDHAGIALVFIGALLLIAALVAG